jgi:hypothetical protein
MAILGLKSNTGLPHKGKGCAKSIYHVLKGKKRFFKKSDGNKRPIFGRLSNF